MKPIYQAWFCHIDITNYCWKDCVYCSRFSRHIRKDQRAHMSLEKIETALKSLKGWPNKIGIIGGEPTIHPQFKEICDLLLDYYPPEKYGLWTTGGPNWARHKATIQRTFPQFVAFNEHTEAQQNVCKHQPATLAINDVVKDAALRKQLIDNCWVQLNWCPTIGDKGAFFCEVAYALDTIHDGPGGYEVAEKWWNKKPIHFQDQVDRWCGHCGMAVPFTRQLLKDAKELISKGNYELYKKLKLPHMAKHEVEIFEDILSAEDIKKFAKGWDPRNYRGDLRRDGTYSYE